MSDDRNIERLRADAALLRARKNDLRRYPSPERDGDRLYPLATPQSKASFQIGPDDTVFAIGSCFARNVEKALEGAGKRVLSREFELGAIGETLDDAANFFNKYSIHSVLNEMRWALDRSTFPGEDILYEVGRDRFVDAQLGMARLDFPVDEIMAFRHRYLDAMARVADADVVILTLGYVETWYDTKLKLYLNVVPPMQIVKEDPTRFEFRVLSYHDILSGLEELLTLLRRHRTKPLRMLVTVSPVPLLNTFRDMDVLVANAYSKAVQRAALEEFVLDKAGVDYFPSYEFVALSNPTAAWSRGDYRHVNPDLITRIMDNVLTRYVADGEDGGGLTADALRSSARMLVKMGQDEELVALVEANRAEADRDPELLLLEAGAARRLERLDDSFDALAKAHGVAPARPDALERMILLCRPMRAKDRARALMDEHARDFPDRAEFRDKVNWL